jgi:hypothetical protein
LRSFGWKEVKELRHEQVGPEDLPDFLHNMFASFVASGIVATGFIPRLTQTSEILMFVLNYPSFFEEVDMFTAVGDFYIPYSI